MSNRRCGVCGGPMVLLFQFYSCDGACHRAKQPQPEQRPGWGDRISDFVKITITPHPAPPMRTLWTPAAGDWARVVRHPTFAGLVYKVASVGVHSPGMVYGHAGPGLRVSYVFDQLDIEPWKPRAGEQVVITRGHHAGGIGKVVKVGSVDVTIHVAGLDRFFGFSEFEPHT